MWVRKMMGAVRGTCHSDNYSNVKPRAARLLSRLSHDKKTVFLVMGCFIIMESHHLEVF